MTEPILIVEMIERGEAGPVGLVPTGAFDPGRGYAAREAVVYEGSSYWTPEAVDPGVAPPGSPWVLLVEKGSQGIAATVGLGDVEVVTPDTAPSVTNTGSSQEAVFVFYLPRAAEVTLGTVTTTTPTAGRYKEAIIGLRKQGRRMPGLLQQTQRILAAVDGINDMRALVEGPEALVPMLAAELEKVREPEPPEEES